MRLQGRSLARHRRALLGLLAALLLASLGVLLPAVASQAESTTMCSNGVVPAGWVVTSEYYDSNCPSYISNPLDPNRYNIRNLAADPQGTRVNMCDWQIVPNGWVQVGTTSSTDCGRGVFAFHNWTVIQKVVPGPVVATTTTTRPVQQPAVNHNPRGHLDAVTSPNPGRVRVVGWAADDDRPRTPIVVRVRSGGTLLKEQVANLDRPDVGRVFPALGSAHGFNFGMNAPSGYTIVVCVNGVNLGEGQNAAIGCASVKVK